MIIQAYPRVQQCYTDTSKLSFERGDCNTDKQSSPSSIAVHVHDIYPE